MSLKLVLASTSPYRQLLLQQLGLQFEQADPGIEENELAGELPRDRALRLAQEKALAVAGRYSGDEQRIIIGSDQVAHIGRDIFPKPEQFDRAYEQLARSSGQWVSFSSAICLSDGCSAEERSFAATGSFSPSIKASPEKGKKYHNYMVDQIVSFIEWLRSYHGPIGKRP